MSKGFYIRPDKYSMVAILMVKKRIIGIVGMPGSGKGIVNTVGKAIGLPVVVMGDVVREETAKRGLESTPKNMRKIMLEIRHVEGPAVVAKRCIPKIQESSTDVVVVEGVRSLDEVEEFKKSFNFTLVSVLASPKTRFRRLYKRRRTDDPASWRVFLERDQVELEVGVGSAIAMADYAIINEGGLAQFKKKIRDLLKRLLE